MSKGRQEFTTPNLLTPQVSLVAAPLGNVSDFSLRAIERLKQADLIFCEDTRKIKFWFQELLLDLEDKKLVSLPGDTERLTDFSKFLNFKHWVFLSDAGTPIVSDPGYSLLEWAREKKIKVEALPGPSAPTLLWQWSGGFGLPFIFGGFVPKSKNSKELEDFFQFAQQSKGSFCFFDTRHQILKTLEFLATHKIFSKSRMFLGRDMSKAHEELVKGAPAELVAFVQKRLDKNEGLGELTLLLEASPLESSKNNLAPKLEELLELRHAAPKNAAKLLSQWTQKSVKECYEALIAQKSK